MPMTNSAAQAITDWMPDLGRELLHWHRSYPEGPYFKSGLEFERYIATFRFAYATFMPNHGRSFAELQPRLCHQYKDGVAACDRIDWGEAERIVRAVWARLEDGTVGSVEQKHP